jgi:putative membrane protein
MRAERSSSFLPPTVLRMGHDDLKQPKNPIFQRIPRATYVLLLGCAFGVVFVFSAIHPHHPSDWFLENALVVVALTLLAVLWRRLPLSRISYTLIFIFLCLHEVGAHWTYAEVPYDEWSRIWIGRSINEIFGWHRNHFDRLVHFSYGLLLAYPVREVFLRVANVRGFWGYFLPLDLTMSTSMLYELIEWGTALLVGGSLGAAYLGTQGDEWDAHKDMALASVGALIAMLVTALINRRLNRDFARDWVESLRVKHKQPLGEDEIARLIRRRPPSPTKDEQ